ncbi:MAG: hypothetical protein ABI627_02295, partial [Polyangiaceae bacterium]
DPAAFVDALATPPKYFTGDPAAYKHAIASLFDEFRPLARAAVQALLLASLPSRPRYSWARSAGRGVGSVVIARQALTRGGE